MAKDNVSEEERIYWGLLTPVDDAPAMLFDQRRFIEAAVATLQKEGVRGLRVVLVRVKLLAVEPVRDGG